MVGNECAVQPARMHTQVDLNLAKVFGVDDKLELPFALRELVHHALRNLLTHSLGKLFAQLAADENITCLHHIANRHRLRGCGLMG